MDIFLNLFDLYKIGRHLKMKNSKELFSGSIIELVKGQNNMFIPKLKFKKTVYQFCPFIINDVDPDYNVKGFCSLHPYIKPLVCILAPVSKVFDPEIEKTEYRYTAPTLNCPGDKDKTRNNLKDTIEVVKKEIEYDNIFFTILDKIKEAEITDYEKIYYFDLDQNFNSIIARNL